MKLNPLLIGLGIAALATVGIVLASKKKVANAKIQFIKAEEV